MINYLLNSLITFGLVILSIMLKNFSKQDLNESDESDENSPKDALHMYAENEPAMERNEVALNDLPGGPYTCMQKMNLLWREMKLL